MYYAGCDVGSLTAKAVIIDDDTMISSAVIQAGLSPKESGGDVMAKALSEAGLSFKDLKGLVGTGYGREMIPHTTRTESEISCHALGAVWGMPSCRMVIDIGGQDAKAIKIDEHGHVLRYQYNDKCASGTGRFLEIMAEAMDVRLSDLGDLAEQATEDISISSQCVIFAETEVVSLLNDDKAVPDIIRALHKSMAGRVASLARGIGIDEDIVMTGGVAKNRGLFSSLALALNKPLKMLHEIDPQINGALGAALFARDFKN